MAIEEITKLVEESVTSEVFGVWFLIGAARVACDEAETLTAKTYWPMPTYADLLFGVK